MSEPARKPDTDIAEFERRLRPTAPRNEDPLAELARLVSAGPETRARQPIDALSSEARAALTADEQNFLNELSLAVDRSPAPERQPARDVSALARAQAAIDRAAAQAGQAAAEANRLAAETAASSGRAPSVAIGGSSAKNGLRGGLDLHGLEEMTHLEDIARETPPPPVETPALPKVNLHAPVFPRPVSVTARPETQAAPEAAFLAEAQPHDMANAPRDLDAGSSRDERFEEPDDAPVAVGRAPRRRKAVAAAVVLVGLGVAATGVALIMKRGPRAASGEPPTIMASSEPVKTAPPAAPAALSDKADDLLARKAAGAKPDAGAKAVGRAEEPVDLAREAQKIVRTVPIAGAQDPTVPRTPTGDSASPDRLSSVFPEPRRVRTVSVRPDGTVIGGDLPPTPPKPPVAAVPPPPPVVAKPASRDVTPSAPDSPPSRTALAEDAAPRTRQAAPATQTPAVPPPPRRPAVAEKPAEPKVEKPAPVRRAAAPPPPPAAPVAEPEAEAPAERSSNPFAALFGRKQEQPAPVTTASTGDAGDEDRPAAKTAARTSVGTGGFAVQLSSSPSESDARAAASRLGGRFAGQLGGRPARVVKGEAGGKTVYRVRAGGMSREGAVASCTNIKSAGGSCFVTQD